MERKKLELKPNEKIILELLFDNPHLKVKANTESTLCMV